MGKMCLFPWLNYGDIISHFEKSHFLVGLVIFDSVEGGMMWHFYMKDVSIHADKIFKKCRKIEIFSESFRNTSKLSIDSFMSL